MIKEAIIGRWGEKGKRMEAMVKLLLVDDEFFVLDQIRQCISWEEFGVELIGCCENAMDALEEMINEVPDILITDIKMPLMDGLELVARAKQMNPAIQCVVLSGYAEFALAKAAMNQGVFNYLLKPFSKTEFEDVLSKCIEKIRKSRSERILQLEQRTELISKLAAELQILKENYEIVDARKIQALMKFYPDLSLLREACLFLMVRYSENVGALKIRYIPEFYNAGKDIYNTAADLLNQIYVKVNESEMIRKIKEYTCQNYCREELNLQWISENVVHLGVKYVGRSFLKETGVKYSEYLSGIRIEKARGMMKHNGDIRVEEIAEQIGLGHDVPYFYQLFKKHTGMTPKEYKKRKNTD